MFFIMAIFQILIVDHQRKTREDFRAAIKSLGSNFTVVTVPSGEEALLEIRTQVFDLLVSNVNLPGISGIELLAKAKNRNRDLKVILVVNGNEEKNSKVAFADAEAIYHKRSGSTGFIDVVKQCLALDEGEYKDQVDILIQEPEENVSTCIEKLHQVLGSSTLVLLDHLGRIQAQVGEISDSSVVLPLMAVFSSSQRVGRFLKKSSPGSLQFFPGIEYDLLLSIVGSSYLLVAFNKPAVSGDEIGKILTALYEGASKLESILIKIGIELGPEAPSISEKGFEEAEPEDREPILDALFQNVEKMVPKTKDVDAFWDSITGGETASEPQNADGLSYDQAIQLGFGPEEDVE